jgi:hypothetical protein
VFRCPLTCAVNGQQHSSSCFVCNSQCHGLVQGGAPAPATSGLARARLLPPPPGIRHPPPLGLRMGSQHQVAHRLSPTCSCVRSAAAVGPRAGAGLVAAEAGAHAEAAGHWRSNASNGGARLGIFSGSEPRDQFLRKREPRKLEQPLWR